jgi:hypothetical protein
VLGPEHIAIVKIRLISILISFSCQIVKFFLNAHSGLFNMFYESETKSHFEEITANKFKVLNVMWPISAILINALSKLISYNLNKKLNLSEPIFTIEHQPVCSIKPFPSFNFSMIAFPSALLLAFISSFTSRNNRLLFFYPAQITLLSIILPLVIIYKHKKLKSYFKHILINPLIERLMYNYMTFKRMNSSTVSPLFI